MSVKIKLSAEQEAVLDELSIRGSAADSALRIACEFHQEVIIGIQKEMKVFWTKAGEEHGLDTQNVPYHIQQFEDGLYIVPAEVPVDMELAGILKLAEQPDSKVEYQEPGTMQ